MTAWIKGNKIELSLIVALSMVVGIITTTMTYAEKQAEQNANIAKNQAAIAQNAKDICELTDLVEKHVEAAAEAADKTIKMESDVDHIKSDIREIKYLLRGYSYEENH